MSSIGHVLGKKLCQNVIVVESVMVATLKKKLGPPWELPPDLFNLSGSKPEPAMAPF